MSEQPQKKVDVRLIPKEQGMGSVVVQIERELARNAAILTHEGRFFVYGSMSKDYASLIYHEVSAPVEV